MNATSAADWPAWWRSRCDREVFDSAGGCSGHLRDGVGSKSRNRSQSGSCTQEPQDRGAGQREYRRSREALQDFGAAPRSPAGIDCMVERAAAGAGLELKLIPKGASRGHACDGSYLIPRRGGQTKSYGLFLGRQETGIAQDCVVELAGLKPANERL